MSLLSVADLDVNYGPERAVRGLSFAVSAGVPVCLLGANGAGKTSTMLAVTGMVRPSGGTVTVRGGPANRRDARWYLDHGVALVPEGQRNFGALTVQENLELPGRALGTKHQRETFDNVFDLFPVLAERRSQKAGLLSGGEQKMLAIGRGLLTGPEVLCVDEPTLGLAPVVIKRILTALSALSERGIGVLISEQSLSFVEAIGGDVLVLERGTCTWRGAGAGLSQITAVAEALLGRGTTAGRARRPIA